MAPGSFTVNFSQEFTPTAIIESIKEWGHVVVTPQEIDVDTLNDSDILNASRYTGIVLNRTLEEGVVTVTELVPGPGVVEVVVLALGAAGLGVSVSDELLGGLTSKISSVLTRQDLL